MTQEIKYSWRFGLQSALMTNFGVLHLVGDAFSWMWCDQFYSTVLKYEKYIDGKFCLASKSTVKIVARVVSVAFLVIDHKTIYKRKVEERGGGYPLRMARCSEWLVTLLGKRWIDRWTVWVMGNLGPCLNRKCGEIDYFFTHFLKRAEDWVAPGYLA